MIKNNKNKIEKEVLSLRAGGQKVILFKANSVDDTLEFIKERIAVHMQQDKTLNPQDIMILGRRKKHYSGIKQVVKGKGYRFLTIHKAKGFEARIVFITGLTHGSGGFPDTWLSDSIYQVLKKTDKEMLLEEERRLFYVAITRAKEFLYLLSENENQSQFIDELSDDFIDEIVASF